MNAFARERALFIEVLVMLARKILQVVLDESWPVGAHLTAAALATRMKVSRTPVSKALELLREKGAVLREANRGYFLAVSANEVETLLTRDFQEGVADPLGPAYFQLAEDRLNGRLSDEVTEAELKTRYGLTGGQLHALLHRIAEEGWMQKRPGYGWDFSPILTTPGSLLQSYRLRLALEPAALLEPGYHLDGELIARLRSTELRLLDGGIESATADQLHDRGVVFHEALVQASGNVFFTDAVHRVHRLRRLLSYRSMKNRTRYEAHCLQHLEILRLLEAGDNAAASNAMRTHLSATIKNLEKISGLLGSGMVTEPPDGEAPIRERNTTPTVVG